MPKPRVTAVLILAVAAVLGCGRGRLNLNGEPQKRNDDFNMYSPYGPKGTSSDIEAAVLTSTSIAESIASGASVYYGTFGSYRAYVLISGPNGSHISFRGADFSPQTICADDLGGEAEGPAGCVAGQRCQVTDPVDKSEGNTPACRQHLHKKLELILDAKGRHLNIGGLGTVDLLVPAVSKPWRMLPSENAPPALNDAHAEAIGQTVLLWGKTSDTKSLVIATFDVSNATWGSVALPATIPATMPIAISWTGKRLVLLTPDGKGAAYDLTSREWLLFPTQGSPRYPSVDSFAMSASDSYVMTWQPGASPKGAIYDVTGATWRSVQIQNAPQTTRSVQIAWSGKEFLIWSDEPGYTKSFYDPASDAWRALSLYLNAQNPFASDPLPEPLRGDSFKLFSNADAIYAANEGHVLSFNGVLQTWKEVRGSWPVFSPQPMVGPSIFHNWLLSSKVDSSQTSHLLSEIQTEGLRLTLPQWPLSVRWHAASVYTGQAYFVWGGCLDLKQSTCTVSNDGAIINFDLPASEN